MSIDSGIDDLQILFLSRKFVKKFVTHNLQKFLFRWKNTDVRNIFFILTLDVKPWDRVLRNILLLFNTVRLYQQ